MRLKKTGIGLLVMTVIFVGAGLLWYQHAFAPTPSSLPNQPITAPEQATTEVTDLTVPWEIVWLPDTTILITERVGTLLQITPSGEQTRLEVPRVSAHGEGGLLGMALHPEFSDNSWLYLYRTYQTDDRRNEVVRYTYQADTHELTEPNTIITNIPGARYHDGGRIAFGPDDYLYITTGDAGDPQLAQDRASLAGKILRVTDTGTIPDTNPFGTAVYSYGHRNPQGIAWDERGQLWSTEHGRSGVLSGMDELNKIVAGHNYGWPVIEGDETESDMTTPVAHSGPDETWAPASLTAIGNTLFFGGLRGARLYQATIVTADTVSLQTYFANEFGRIRTTALGPDQALYLLTSNTDGRGQPSSEDDRLIRIPLEQLQIVE